MGAGRQDDLWNGPELIQFGSDASLDFWKGELNDFNFKSANKFNDAGVSAAERGIWAELEYSG